MLYFAYGSNMSRARIEKRLGPCVLQGHAWLPGYGLRFHKRGADGSAKCDAWRIPQKSSDETLHGVLHALDASQRERLDGFEGAGYRVEWVRALTKASYVRCFLYVTRPEAIDASLRPFAWYHTYVLEGAKENALPGAYIKRLEAVANQILEDPDQ